MDESRSEGLRLRVRERAGRVSVLRAPTARGLAVCVVLGLIVDL